MTSTSPFSLIGEFTTRRHEFVSFTAALTQLIRNLLSASDISVLAVESRTKTTESFSDKVRSDEKAGKYSALDDVTDLTGVRVIAYLKEDCDKICELITQNFDIDVENSIVKGADREDQFGYSSTHFVFSLDARRTCLPEFAPFKNMKAEIQIRTVLQHAWAALDWRFRYKTASEAPAEIRRKLFRIAATLEGADEGFSEVYSAVSNLRAQYADNVKTGALDVRINADSLDSFLRHSEVVEELFLSFVNAGFKPSEPDEDGVILSRLLGHLADLEIKKLSQIDEILNEERHQFENIARVCEEETRKAFPEIVTPTTTKATVVRLAIVIGLSEGTFDQVARKFFSNEAAAAVEHMRRRIAEKAK